MDVTTASTAAAEAVSELPPREIDPVIDSIEVMARYGKCFVLGAAITPQGAAETQAVLSLL